MKLTLFLILISPKILLALRLLFVLHFISAFVCSFLHPYFSMKKFIFFCTHIAYVMTFAYLVASSYYSYLYSFQRKHFEYSQKTMFNISKEIYWNLYTMCVAMAPLVTLVFWVEMHNTSDPSIRPDTPLSYYLSISMHGVNAIIMGFEFAVVRLRYPFKKIIYLIIGMVCYIVWMNMAPVVVGKTLDGSRDWWPYPIFDFRNPMEGKPKYYFLIGYAGVCGFQIIFYTLFWFLDLVRNRHSTVDDEKTSASNMIEIIP